MRKLTRITTENMDAFAKAAGWGNAENLALDLGLEVGELVDLFADTDDGDVELDDIPQGVPTEEMGLSIVHGRANVVEVEGIRTDENTLYITEEEYDYQLL